MTTYFQIQDLLTHPSRWNLDVSNDGDCPLGTLLINTSTLLAAIIYISFLLSKWQVYCLLINCRWLSTVWQPFLFSFAKKLDEENRKIYYPAKFALIQRYIVHAFHCTWHMYLLWVHAFKFLKTACSLCVGFNSSSRLRLFFLLLWQDEWLTCCTTKHNLQIMNWWESIWSFLMRTDSFISNTSSWG